ncbi:MAG: hypothetical protein F4Z50_05970 [Gemmatimonadetes bacterium]|nr:hypothetical protein [Gemmatimonadota bacterium]MYD14382.1 hypothetical protein [Gemmatimonadota bacterium]
MNPLTPPARSEVAASSLRQAAILALCVAPLATPSAHGQDLASAPVREVREILRLGDAVDVPDWLTFAAEPRLMLDASGRLFAVPGNDPRIRLLSPDGQFIRYIGNRGIDHPRLLSARSVTVRHP